MRCIYLRLMSILLVFMAAAPALAGRPRQAPVGATPEPSALLLFAAGAGFFAWATLRRSKR
jgi:hypothetical protein